MDRIDFELKVRENREDKIGKIEKELIELIPDLFEFDDLLLTIEKIYRKKAENIDLFVDSDDAKRLLKEALK
jgi:hypothetical protein